MKNGLYLVEELQTSYRGVDSAKKLIQSFVYIVG